MLQRFLQNEQEVFNLVNSSFLTAEIKTRYIELYNDKRKRLGTSLTGLL
jgi:hypothetical protein